MDREQAKALLPIIKAFSEGKIIEYRDSMFKDDWKIVKEIPNLSFGCFEYRIKPEHQYRPFKDTKECWQEMLKHKPFGWIKCKEEYFNIVYVNDDYVGLADKDGSAILLASKNSYQDNTFADGTPFGIRENF